MTDFTLHTIESAPQQSKNLLQDSLKNFGMIPNLHAVMAEAPAVLEGYKKIAELFQNTSFNNEEITVIWLTINVEHRCHYCVPAHTAIAHMMKVDPMIIDDLRTEKPLKDAKLNALKTIVLSIVRNRGKVDSAEIEAFFKVGYNKQQLLEVVLGVSHKVMSNYINHLAETPVDEAFAAFVWSKS